MAATEATAQKADTKTDPKAGAPAAKRLRPEWSHDDGNPMIAVWMGLISIVVYVAFTQFGTTPPVARASHILVKEQGKARDLLKQLGRGADFAELAAKHSQCPTGERAGGALGSFSPGRMVAEFDKVIFDEATKVGQVYGPVRARGSPAGLFGPSAPCLWADTRLPAHAQAKWPLC